MNPDFGGPAPVIIARPEHNISRANISDNALKVLYRLKQAGYQSFLVGGGVRDLLLGREPKDFDVATDAHPEDVRRLFRNCRLIGRRFRLAHVHFGRDVIEVATFRGAAGDDEAEPAGDLAHDDSGRILRDNVYGTIEADVWRRDFTANSLYYNIDDFSIWDFTGGVDDIRTGVLRLIGDPERRYQEDPVRMLRAVRFAAKLGFRLHEASERPLATLGPLLELVPPARLLDECAKLFMGGAAVQTFELLRHYDLFRYLFPATDAALSEPDAGAFRNLVALGLKSTDERIAEDKPVTPVFLFAVLLWEPVRRLARELQADGESEAQALRIAVQNVALHQQEHVSMPRRFVQAIAEILALQPRFELRDRRALKLLEHPRFRAAYDFLVLRASAGEVEEELASWWTRLQELDPDRRRAELGEPKRQRGGRRRRRGGRGRRGAGRSGSRQE